MKKPLLRFVCILVTVFTAAKAQTTVSTATSDNSTEDTVVVKPPPSKEQSSSLTSLLTGALGGLTGGLGRKRREIGEPEYDARDHYPEDEFAYYYPTYEAEANNNDAVTSSTASSTTTLATTTSTNQTTQSVAVSSTKATEGEIKNPSVDGLTDNTIDNIEKDNSLLNLDVALVKTENFLKKVQDVAANKNNLKEVATNDLLRGIPVSGLTSGGLPLGLGRKRRESPTVDGVADNAIDSMEKDNSLLNLEVALVKTENFLKKIQDLAADKNNLKEAKVEDLLGGLPVKGLTEGGLPIDAAARKRREAPSVDGVADNAIDSMEKDNSLLNLEVALVKTENFLKKIQDLAANKNNLKEAKVEDLLGGLPVPVKSPTEGGLPVDAVARKRREAPSVDGVADNAIDSMEKDNSLLNLEVALVKTENFLKKIQDLAADKNNLKEAKVEDLLGGLPVKSPTEGGLPVDAVARKRRAAPSVDGVADNAIDSMEKDNSLLNLEVALVKTENFLKKLQDLAANKNNLKEAKVEDLLGGLPVKSPTEGGLPVDAVARKRREAPSVDGVADNAIDSMEKDNSLLNLEVALVKTENFLKKIQDLAADKNNLKEAKVEDLLGGLPVKSPTEGGLPVDAVARKRREAPSVDGVADNAIDSMEKDNSLLNLEVALVKTEKFLKKLQDLAANKNNLKEAKVEDLLGGLPVKSPTEGGLPVDAVARKRRAAPSVDGVADNAIDSMEKDNSLLNLEVALVKTENFLKKLQDLAANKNNLKEAKVEDLLGGLPVKSPTEGGLPVDAVARKRREAPSVDGVADNAIDSMEKDNSLLNLEVALVKTENFLKKLQDLAANKNNLKEAKVEDLLGGLPVPVKSPTEGGLPVDSVARKRREAPSVDGVADNAIDSIEKDDSLLNLEVALLKTENFLKKLQDLAANKNNLKEVAAEDLLGAANNLTSGGLPVDISALPIGVIARKRRDTPPIDGFAGNAVDTVGHDKSASNADAALEKTETANEIVQETGPSKTAENPNAVSSAAANDANEEQSVEKEEQQNFSQMVELDLDGIPILEIPLN